MPEGPPVDEGYARRELHCVPCVRVVRVDKVERGASKALAGGVEIHVERHDTRVTVLRKFGIPGWLSVVPPLFTIVLAVATQQVLIALFLGVWLGATFVGLGLRRLL